jgi:hypothetical protein
MKKRMLKNLNFSEKELDNLSEYFRAENEVRNQALVIEFLALTIEALRLEFGFGQKRIDQYTKRVDSLLDSVNMGYVSFEDLLDEISISPMKVAKMSEENREKILKEIEKRRGQK